MKLRVFITLFVLIAGTIAFLSWQAPKMAEKTLSDYFASIGFKYTSISKVSLSPAGVLFTDIKLDKDSFSTIEAMAVRMNWPAYLFSKKVDSVAITEIVHNDIASEIDLKKIKQWLNPDYLKSLPLKEFSVEHAQINLASDLGDIRIEAKGLVNTTEEGSKTIQAVIWARQFQLGFQIPISGLIKPDGSFVFESTFNDGKLNIGALRLSRLSGWASIKGQDNFIISMASQFDAGSANFATIPLQDVSFALSRVNNTVNAVMRSGFTGAEKMKLSADVQTKNGKPEAVIVFDAPEETEFKNFLKTHANLEGDISVPDAISLTFLPDRQFEGGPVPFDFMAKNDEQDYCKGILLFYPDKWAIRGSLSGEDEAIELYKKLFSPDDEIESTSIKIDVLFKDWFKKLSDNQG